MRLKTDYRLLYYILAKEYGEYVALNLVEFLQKTDNKIYGN